MPGDHQQKETSKAVKYLYTIAKVHEWDAGRKTGKKT